ncbi:glycosyltransferase family 87 protein [Mucilaginibacter arboris]|uniref:DUF2029 domain-containing protein n=1 Tax=Mucilaginibacter arboris TaxID=2682090 RepID=A0A7K1SYN2_9SPHI|nr:glycosyltransferase family 87 protein [Mucilaginibacter arboris]MVN22140.1 DUF2029 domain-containing protein [Mucilaginibacter arboris]
MTIKLRSITNYQWVCLLYIAVAAFCFFYKFRPEHYNNYLIFKGVYYHTKAQTNLYAYYPKEYGDSNHYGPVFSLIVAPFAVLPDSWGFFLWSIVNAIVLVWVIHLLPLAENRKMLILLFCVMEFANAEHYIQFNPIITAFILLSFILIEKKQDGWATLFIVLGTLVKLYPIAGLTFYLFSKNKPKFILSTVFWTVIFLTLPMLISSSGFIMQSYKDWYISLHEKNQMNEVLNSAQDMSVMGVFRALFHNPDLPNLPFLGGAVLIFGAALLRKNQYVSLKFRMQVLCSALLMVVLFSTGSEHPTYIIAVTGAVIWVFMQPQPFTNANVIYLVLLVLITGLGLTDACPKYLREEWVVKYVMKAWPCIFVWARISYELILKDFTTEELQDEKYFQDPLPVLVS